MPDERRPTGLRADTGRRVPDLERRRTLVLTAAAFAVPILALLAFAAVDGTAALNVVIVGIGVVAVLTPWATSGWQGGDASDGGRDAGST